MNKSFIVTFSVSVIIFATAVVILLMLLLPKQLVSLQTSVEKYETIEKSLFTYTKTKDISKEALLKEYKVTDADIAKFKQNYNYIPGNSDPFYDYNQNNNTNTGGSSNGGSTSAGNSSSSQQAIDKTTNSNGGVPNPESTKK